MINALLNALAIALTAAEQIVYPIEKSPRKPISQTFKATNIPFLVIRKVY